MDLPKTQDWTVVACREGKTEPNPHGGQLTKFYVDFIGADETEVPDVYWRRKEGNKPEVNKAVFGTIKEGNYGPMFNLEQKDGAQRPSGLAHSPPPNGPAFSQGFVPDTERQRRIERQHSQHMALLLIDASRDAGDLNLDDADMTSTYLNEVVRKLTDWFAKDLEQR